MLSPLTRRKVIESVLCAVCRYSPWHIMDVLILRPIALILLCVALRKKRRRKNSTDSRCINNNSNNDESNFKDELPSSKTHVRALIDRDRQINRKREKRERKT